MADKRYETEIKNVFEELTNMGFAAERAVERAMKALTERDYELAQEVVDGDREIDQLCHEIEDKSLKILLLDAPFAHDFLEVSGALKMITDLERIGDYASDIAEEVLNFPKDEPYIKKLDHISLMGQIVTGMVADAVRYYIGKDVEKARELEKRDDKVDSLFLLVKKELIDSIKEREENAEQAIIFMMIAKYLERIGDHAVNIGEWVDYSITGKHQDS
jgi:phosphate transport system protein